MSDDPVPKVDAHDPWARVYDYFKHITTLSLVAIGGVLSLLQGSDLEIPKRAYVIVIGLLGGAGALAFLAINSMTSTELMNRPLHAKRTALLVLQIAATGLLMLGLGIFLGLFTRLLR
jgi:hypothetical protein